MKEGTSIVNTEEYRDLLKMKEDLQNECEELRVGLDRIFLTKRGVIEEINEELEAVRKEERRANEIWRKINNNKETHPLEFGKRLFIFGLLVVAAVGIHNTLGFHPISYICAFLCGVAAMRVVNQMILDSKS